LGTETSASSVYKSIATESLWLRVCVFALALLIPLTYAPALNNHLLSDSYHMVGQFDFPEALRYFYQTTGFGRNEFRPLTQLTYAWDNFLWQDRPFGYHLTNLLLHTANGILLLLIFFRMSGSVLMAFSAAALYSIHPANHSRVAWIAARDSVVCMFFLLISWLVFLYNRPRSEAAPGDAVMRRGRSPALLRGLSYAAFFCALLSYEGATAFPFILAAFELLSTGTSFWPERIRGALKTTAPYFLLLAIYLAWWMVLFRGSVGGYDLDLSVGGMARDFYRMHYRLFHHIQHWLGLAYLLAACWVWSRRRQLAPLLGGAVALLWLGYLPFVAVHGFADRFGFLSVIGVALFLSLSVSEIASANRLQFRLAAILPALLMLLFVGYYTQSTGRRLREWQEAGQMADSMLTGLKALHPSFPPEATLVFDQVPAMHGNAYVFPTGWRAAVRSRYSQNFRQISYYSTALEASRENEMLQREPAFHFRYLPDKGLFVELRARRGKSGR